MNAEILETIRATILGLGMQIPEIPAHRKFVYSSEYQFLNMSELRIKLKKKSDDFRVVSQHCLRE